jgi:TnpA family transposase
LFANKKHISAKKLDNALKDTINHYNLFELPKLWGSQNTAIADGTQFDLYERNLMSESHIRYGGHGGIAYHHISDTYIALFSHFIPCGVWEAIYIIEGLLKNKSDIRIDTVHADTQGQSAIVFALCYLLGIELEPRIRNWKDLKFYRSDKNIKYNNIDNLFTDVTNWEMIEKHWMDMMQVVLSIREGKISSAVLLRRLGNYSKKNKLYQAFREFGRVVRTIFLLDYISDNEKRQRITASTNKIESYNQFSQWFFFGLLGVISSNYFDEQEKSIKYNDLIANIVMLQNVADMSLIIQDLRKSNIIVNDEDLAFLSPYITSSTKRFGNYSIDIMNKPPDLERFMKISI